MISIVPASKKMPELGPERFLGCGSGSLARRVFGSIIDRLHGYIPIDLGLTSAFSKLRVRYHLLVTFLAHDALLSFEHF
jgi:hypothetical protein